MENQEILNKILEKLEGQEKKLAKQEEFQEEARNKFASQEKFQEEVRERFTLQDNRLTLLEEGQGKMYDLLVAVSERVSEPLDNVGALENRMWNAEKMFHK